MRRALVVGALAFAGAAGCDGCRHRAAHEDAAAPPAAASDEGALHVDVRDGDGELPLIVRIVIRSLDGSRSDLRVVDARYGELDARLRPGRYRVSATKGVEWSMDAEVVDVVAGRSVAVALRLRHVVRSDTLVPCDLHLDASPGIDSKTTDDDRVLSAAAAGIKLAVATEHNAVGDYAPALSRTALVGKITVLAGLEITTSDPAIGQFGVFPFARGIAVPRSQQTTAAAALAAARTGGPSSVIVVHRPRTPHGDGYFDAMGFDAAAPRIPDQMSTGFDALEVYGGQDLAEPARALAVLRDWFALLELGKHVVAVGSSGSLGDKRPWAGLPRTYVEIGLWKQGYSGGPFDLDEALDAVRGGRGFVTSGPTIDFAVAGAAAGDSGVNKGLGTTFSVGEGDVAKPGAEIRALGRVGAHLRIRAPSWMVVSKLEVIAGGTVVYQAALPSRPMSVGKEQGSQAEAAQRAIRFDADIAFTPPGTARWLVVVVSGEHADEDAVPGVALQPLAFTNPIWLTR